MFLIFATGVGVVAQHSVYKALGLISNFKNIQRLGKKKEKKKIYND